MKTNRKSIMAYVKKRLTRFLLFFVILSSGVTVHFAAQAKYSSYLYDYTGVVAGDFCFSSNFLGSREADLRYEVASWNGKDYEITLEIRNFENALRFNKPNSGFYYYVVANMYRDFNLDGIIDEDTELNQVFSSTITYQDGTQKGAFTPEGSDHSIPCAYMPGTENYDRLAGTHEVKIEMHSRTGAVTEQQFLVIKAFSIPRSQAGQIEGITEEEQANYAAQHAFGTVLESTFILNSGRDIDIESVLKVSETDYTVLYQLKCNRILGSTTGKIRIYYNAEKLDPDNALGNPTVVDETFRYVEVTMSSNSLKNCYFYKKAMGTEVHDEIDIYYRTDDTGGETVPDTPPNEPEPIPE